MNNLNWLDNLPEKNPEIIKRGLILPQLPQLAPEKLGQLEPNKDAMPQLPQLAPTVFNMNQNREGMARRVYCAGRELNSRHKTGLMQRNRATLKGTPTEFTIEGNSNLEFSDMCDVSSLVNCRSRRCN